MVGIMESTHHRKYGFLYFLIGCFLLILVVTSFLGYRSMSEWYFHRTMANLQGVSDVIKDNINHYITSEMQQVESLAKSPIVIDFLRGKATSEALTTVLKKNIKEYDALPVVIFSTKHVPLFSSDNRLPFYASQERIRESLQRSLFLTTPDLSDFLWDPANNKQILFITVAIVADQEFLGSFAMKLPLQHFSELLSNYYRELGKTGEIIIGKKIFDKIVAIFPTRFNADAAFDEKIHYGSALSRAVMGEKGASVVSDTLTRKSLVVWQYMPFAEWGLEVKVSYEESMRSLLPLKIALLVVLLLGVICALYCFYRSWLHIRDGGFLNELTRYTFLTSLYVFFIINNIFLLLVIVRYAQDKEMRIQKNKTALKVSVQNAAQQMGHRVFMLEAVGHSLAFDAGDGKIDVNSVQSRAERDLKDNTDISDIIVLFKKGKDFDVRSFMQKKGEVAEGSLQLLAPQIDALKRNIEQVPLWSYVERDKKEGDLLFSVPFYGLQDFDRASPLGVVGLVYPQDVFLDIARDQIKSPLALDLLDRAARALQPTELHHESAGSALKQSKRYVHMEKIPHLGWYIESAIALPLFSLSEFLKLCFGIIFGIVLMGLIAYHWVFSWAMPSWKSNRWLGYVGVAVSLLTCLQYLLVR